MKIAIGEVITKRDQCYQNSPGKGKKIGIGQRTLASTHQSRCYRHIYIKNQAYALQSLSSTSSHLSDPGVAFVQNTPFLSYFSFISTSRG